MRIYLLRHEIRFANPQFDTQLSEVGKQNAKNLVKLLNNLNINIIISSPFVRTIQTVEEYVKNHNIKLNIDYALNESVSDTNLFDKTDIRPLNENMYGFKYFNLNYNPVVKCEDLFLGESYDDIKLRTRKLIDDLINNKSLVDKNILLVSHQSTVNAALNIDQYFDYPMGGVCLCYETNRMFKPINF